jgi:cobalt-precorrin-5B (C1)-methyltransferase
MVKLGQGMIDLHSRAGPVDLAWLAERAREAGADAAFAEWIPSANGAGEVLQRALATGLPIGDVVAAHAFRTAAKTLAVPDSRLEIVVFDRAGGLVGRVPFRQVGG